MCLRFWAGVLFAGGLWAQDAKALVEQGLRRDEAYDELAQKYAFLETVAEQEWKDSRKAALKLETFEVLNLYGQPYRRLVKRDGKPLPPAEEQKEQQKLDKVAAQRAKESPAQRERRLANYREERRRGRAFLKEIGNAYRFQMAGETQVAGRDAWIVDATPLPGYKPKDSRAAKILPKFRGRFYLSKKDSSLLRLEAEAIDTVSFGLVLARLDKGARFTMATTHVNNELWMPARINVNFDARLALFKKMRVDVQIDYTDFRKFQSDSRLIAAEPLQP